VKTLAKFVCSLITIVFLATIIPCEAGGNRQRGGHNDGRNREGHEHHHHHRDHSYRWFGVIPRPQWAPYSGYYAVPQYAVPQQYYYVPPPPHAMIGAPTVEISEPRHEVILVPQERQSFEDYQKPIHIPVPPESVAETEPLSSQPSAPQTPTPRRTNPSKATTIEKYVTGEASCPIDLPRGGIVRVCNAKSGKYKISQERNEKYFHQQQCWFCENILGGDYVRWQDGTK